MSLKDMIVDHIDGNGLNNRRSNLRYCTSKQNAQNLKKHRSKTGVIGVRKDTRCYNSYRAQIYFSSKQHIEKTYKDEELAIIQRLCWELMYFGDFAPQIDLIKEKYPHLLNYYKVKNNAVFSTNMELIRDMKENCNHCENCLNENNYPCKIFVPIEEDTNILKKKYPDIYAAWLENKTLK